MRLTHKRVNEYGYRSQANKQELINRLAEYENIGEPDEINFLLHCNLDNVVEQLEEIQSMLKDKGDRKEIEMEFNQGNDCDLCKFQYMTGRDGTDLGCERADQELSCKFEEEEEE